MTPNAGHPRTGQFLFYEILPKCYRDSNLISQDSFILWNNSPYLELFWPQLPVLHLRLKQGEKKGRILKIFKLSCFEIANLARSSDSWLQTSDGWSDFGVFNRQNLKKSGQISFYISALFFGNVAHFSQFLMKNPLYRFFLEIWWFFSNKEFLTEHYFFPGQSIHCKNFQKNNNCNQRFLVAKFCHLAAKKDWLWIIQWFFFRKYDPI